MKTPDRLTRLVCTASILGGMALAACAPEQPKPIAKSISIHSASPTPTKPSLSKESPYTTSELMQLGQELKTWQLQNRTNMSSLYTEVLLTADLLQGNLDPKTILPQFKAPITFSTDTTIGEATLTKNIDPVDPRKVGIYSQGDLLFYSNWLAKDMSVKLKLGPDIFSSPAKLYIIVKEASQLIYRHQYLKLYIDLLRRNPTMKFDIANPTKLPISEIEEISNIGMLIHNFEKTRYGYSSLDDFIDLGSRLQTAPIGATQRLDMKTKGLSFGNTYWSILEQMDTAFLTSKNLLKEENGIVTWAKPFVIDEDFFQLYADYAPRSIGRPALIRPQN